MNVALNGVVTASSFSIHGNGSFATNGNWSTSGKCSETTLGADLSWLKIDLSSSFRIERINLVAGADAEDLKITIGDTGVPKTDETCAAGVKALKGEAKEVLCGANPLGVSAIPGRYMTVWSSAAVSLCEIQAW